MATPFPRPKDPDAALRAGIAEARKQNKPIEVVEAFTETSRTWALPDGRLTTESYAGSAQAKQADGAWAWIDTTLVEKDGVLKPKVSGVADVEFSAGGEGRPFASMERDKGQRFSLSWDRPLPHPMVTGNVATYPDAAGPGADLVVTALTTGFRHDVVLRERPKGPVEIRIPVESSALTLAKSKRGGLQFTDRKDKVVAEAPQPVMWDSNGGGAQAPKSAPARRTMPVSTSVEKRGDQPMLVLKPDTGWLADPATVFPVVVDPTSTLTVKTDTVLSSGANCTTNDQPGATLLKIGGERVSCNGVDGWNYYRSYLQFDTSALAGKAIYTAALQLWRTESPACHLRGDGKIYAGRVNQTWTAGKMTWANKPGTTDFVATPCPTTNVLTPGAMTWPITNWVKDWASGQPNWGIELKGPTESLVNNWDGYSASFHSAEMTGTGATPPKLVVQYFLPPEIPTVTAESVDTMDGEHAIVRSNTVNMGYKSSSVDGKPLDYWVNVVESTKPIPGTSPQGEAARWPFNEGIGEPVDTSSHGHILHSLGNVSWVDGKVNKAIKVDGSVATPSELSTENQPVVHTNTSYSVAAWVRLDSTTDSYVITQDGTVNSAFTLAYTTADSKWRMEVRDADANGSARKVAKSTANATVGTWTHLVGVYDATAGKIRLYVNGALNGEVAYGPAWDGQGEFRIGGGVKNAGGFAGHAKASVDELRVFPRALTAEEIAWVQGNPPATNAGIPSGQSVPKTYDFGNVDSFKFSVKACLTGVAPLTCSESPYYRITTDAPFVPTDAETGMADPTRPILSGMVSRPSGGPVTAKYFLYDSTGAPVGSSPLGERVVNGGERASFQVPENTVQLGRAYTWQMQACVSEVCTSKTAPVSVTIPGTPTEPPAEDVRHLTLLKDNFVIKAAKTDPTACGGAPCAVTDDTVMRIGGVGTDKAAAVIGFKLDDLPDGATFTESILNLGTPMCPAGTCPADAAITATPLKSPVTSESKGSDLAGDADPEATPYSLPLTGPRVDIAGSEYQWLLLTSNKDEVITFADATATEQPLLIITYLPAGPPSKVLNLNASGGDASAVASWGLPESNGGMALLDGYDVEVVDNGGAVVKAVQVKDPWVAISGLANGFTYTIKVRAKTAFGASDWEVATATTKAVPPPPAPSPMTACIPFLDAPPSAAKTVSVSESGAQEYIDRIRAYYQAQDAVLEGRATAIWDAPGVTASAPSTAKLSLLNAALVQEREALAQDGKSRSGSSVQLTNTVVQAVADGSVRVTAEVKRAWTETSGSTFGTARARSAMSRAGTVEPSEASISVFVFDRCGNVTIIDVPLEVNEDPTDHADRAAGGAAVPPPCGAPRTPGCKSATEERTSCWTADQSLYCEMRQQLGRKNWWLLTSGYAEWGPHEGIGAGCPRECDEFPEHRWKIKKFHSFMHVYPANGQKELNTPFGRAFSKALYSNSAKQGGMEYRSKGCFRKQTIKGEVKGTVALMWEQLGVSGEKTVSGEIAEGCTKDLLLKNDDPNNPMKVSDATGNVQARCTVPVFGECGIERYTHHFTAKMWAYFTVKTTDPKTGKISDRKYSVKANHSTDCYVSRYRKNPIEVVSRPLKCEPVIQELVGGTLD